ncbi:MAG TPA: hypothetical protein VNU97_11725 [Rhizomicrobium sp.]|jgi:hypothetical protein|nr:hypothetical protein [Rhizomicrobium sp.]
MASAGWAQVWHLVAAIVARQPPFLQIMIATGAVFVAVMALEGVRTSLLAMWRAHRTAQHLPAPKEQARASSGPAAAPLSGSLFSPPAARAAARIVRKRKPLTVSARQFRSPRPTIRRYGMLEFAGASELTQSLADAPMDLSDAL